MVSGVLNPVSGHVYSYTWQVVKNNTAFASGSTPQFTFTPDAAALYFIT